MKVLPLRDSSGGFFASIFVGSTIYGAEISRLKQFLFVFVIEMLLKVFYGSPFPTSGYSGDSSYFLEYSKNNVI